MSYNWQQADWPEFRYETDGLAELLLAFADHAGRVGGLLEGLPDDLGADAVLDLMIAEANTPDVRVRARGFHRRHERAEIRCADRNFQSHRDPRPPAPRGTRRAHTCRRRTERSL